MKIMVDLDGCAYNYVDSFAQCVLEQRGLSATPKLGLPWDGETWRWGPTLTEPESWSFYKQEGWGMSTPEFLDSMRAAIREQYLFARGQVYPGAVNGIINLRDAGHELYVVSSRKYGIDTETYSVLQTVDWLLAMRFPQFEEVFILDGSQSKAEVCKKFELTVAIEDSPDNYAELRAAGIDCFLFDRKWNSHVKSHRRVDSWEVFADEVAYMEMTAK